MGIGWKNSKKIRGRSPGFQPYTRQDIKHVCWCHEKNIKIAVVPDWDGKGDEWKIELNINKKIHTDPNRYDNNTVYNKVNEYYKYYYDKYNK